MYLVISLIIFVVSYKLFKKAAGSLDPRKMNMISFCFYCLLTFTFFGSIMVMYELGTSEMGIPQSSEIRFYGWLGVMYTMLMVPLGMIIASFMLRINSKLAFYKYLSVGVQSNHNAKSEKIALYFFSGLSILAIIYILNRVGGDIPLFLLFSGVDDYILLYQRRNTISFIIPDYKLLGVYISLQASFVVCLSYAAYCYWRLNKKFRDLIWFLLMLSFSVLYLTYDMVKGRIIFYFVGLMMVEVIILGKLRIKKLALYCIGGYLLVDVVRIFFHGALKGSGRSFGLLSFLEVGLGGFSGRILLGQLANYYQCFNIFPNLHPFLWFSTTGQFIHETLGLTYLPDYGIIIMAFENLKAVAAGAAGHASTFFMGEAWANFGLFGFLIAPLWVGCFIQILHVFFLNRGKTIINISLYASVTLALPILTNLKGFYYPAGLMQIVVMTFLLLLIKSILAEVGKERFIRRY